MAQSNNSIYLASSTVPICRLEIRSHFDSLSDKEKAYAHYISRASWFGTRIVLRQVSLEAETIYNLILALFPSPEAIHALKSSPGVSELEFTDCLQYAVQFLGNLGNYKSFGDSKFVPRLSKQAFEQIVKASGNQDALRLFGECADRIYALTPESVLMLGYPPSHCSTYYSPNIVKDEIDLVQRFLESKNINVYNTRLFKDDQGDLIVKFASGVISPASKHIFEGRTIRMEFGDHQIEMKKIAEALEKAIPYVANEHQRMMLVKYVESFRSGSIDAHKESQRHWIKDVGPAVESNIGFIESYRDPAGVRSEWEGFAAVVNKEQTRKFGVLVNNAPSLISKLPWDKSFEKDEFHRPDFTSLEVLAFATSGIPAGINIPKFVYYFFYIFNKLIDDSYDDIRQNDGFKNVSLGNILNAQAPNEVITFLTEADKVMFKKWRGPSFEVQVGIHELLGHGSGKLLEQDKDGHFNFDQAHLPVNPDTGKPITSWYKSGETYSSKFGAIASSYEECRAECCGIYLSTDAGVLKIFGHEDTKEAADVMYTNWLSMARAGLLALEVYNAKSKTWGQAHMRARFAILRVMLEAGNGFVSIEQHLDQQDAVIHLDREKIQTVGKKAVGDFLQRLQVYKATADAVAANAMYEKYTSVPDDWLPLRDVVIAKRQPRKVFVQPNTMMDAKTGTVSINEYDATPAGIIQSFVERGV